MPLPLLAAAGALLAPTIGKLVSKLASKPIVKVAASVATALGAGAAYSAATSAPSSLPSLPSLPSIPGLPTSMAQPVGTLPAWRGAGGKLQLPWNDPRIPQVVSQFALDDAYLRQSVRAPRGYVVVRDASGRPYCLERAIAIKMRLWKPARKAPISAGEWNKYKTSQRVAKKLLKIAAPEIRRKHRGKTTVTTTTRRKAA